MTSGRRREVARFVLAAVAVVGLCALGAWRRLLVVSEYRNFAGDGWQYFHLAESLVKQHRYAFGPSLPLAGTRLPGYPILVALWGHNVANFESAMVAVQVTRAQAILDVVTAFFAWLLARESGLRAPPWLALVLCLMSPFLMLCTSYVLSETVAILLTTATLWLLLRAGRTRLTLHLTVAGALLGLGLLVRADALTLVPCFLVPLLVTREGNGARARSVALAIIVFATIFAPWPLRNLTRFKRAYVLGASWVTKGGDPLPTGVQSWLRTWAVDPEVATVDVAWRMTRGDPCWLERLPPTAWDSPVERERVRTLLDDYNRHGLTRTVDEGFTKLATERTHRAPLRTLVRLPLERAWALWKTPVPEWELPHVSPTLRLPVARAALAPLNARTLVLALLGLALLSLLTDGKRLVLLTVVAVLSRSLLVAWVVPGGTQRYLFELLPLVLVLASVALAGVPELCVRELLSREQRSAGTGRRRSWRA